MSYRTMTELEYYRLKSGLLTLQIERQQFLDYATKRHHELLREATLDPTKQYQLDEPSKTAIEVPPPPFDPEIP